MPNALPILLFDPGGHLPRLNLNTRWRIHAFQDVADAEAGLTYLDPEVVVTTMDATGLEFCRKVASRDASRPVIALAYTPNVTDVVLSMRAGVRDIVSIDDAVQGGLNRALEMALGWRKRVQKGIAMAVDRVRDEATSYRRQLDAVDERRRELETQLDAENSLLQQTQRELEVQRGLALSAIRAKSKFLANMSHELHTPLNAIIGYAEMLREELDGRGKQDVDHIIGSSRRLLKLLQEVLNLARLEAGQVHPVFEPVVVGDLLQGVAERATGAARSGQVSLQVDDPGVATVVTDPRRLGEALDQLVDNAVKFSPGGTVELSVTKRSRDGNEWVVFAVADTGVGIGAAELTHIFDAFTQGDGSATRTFGGTGLGLSVSRQIARVLGGRVDARSELGQGSVFEIWVPHTVDPEPVSDTLDAELVVLLIDDDPVLRTMIDRMLVADGHTVISSGSGLEAVELARQHQPSLICLDVTLPGIDGFQVLQALGDDPAVSEIPVVMLSANDEVERALRAGAVGFMRKPVHRGELRDLITQHARVEVGAALLVLGREVPACLEPLIDEGKDVRAVPVHLLDKAIEHTPGAVVVPSWLDIEDLRHGLGILDERAKNLTVVALVRGLGADESTFLEQHFSAVISTLDDPVLRLRRYASAR